jgi:hypothetical protein
VNANGARYDALVNNNGDGENSNWMRHGKPRRSARNRIGRLRSAFRSRA